MNKVYISCKESRIENHRNFYGCFYIGSFEYEMSLTIANALRRTLLSECSGFGIVSVVIENVTHEYSTLKGIRESVLDVLLNLKEIVFKKTTFNLYDENFKKLNSKNAWHLYKKKLAIYNTIGATFFRPLIGYLKIKGPGIVRAKNLILPSFIQCVDPEQYIATLSENGSLCMKFIIMEGKNHYVHEKKEFFDNLNLVKQRQIFFNELFSRGPLRGAHSVAKPKKPLKKESLPQDLVNLENNQQSTFEKVNELNNTNFNRLFLNSMPLHLDTIFNPVKKVNYIIEENMNNIVEDASKNSTLIDQISFLLQSTYYLKKNFSHLNKHLFQTFFDFTSPPSGEKQNESNLNTSFFLKNKKTNAANLLGSPPSGGSAMPKVIVTQSDFNKNLNNIFNSYTASELNNINHFLHPLKKKSKNHTIIMEIWTNGSVHPSDVLKLGLNHLTSLFLNLVKNESFESSF